MIKNVHLPRNLKWIVCDAFPRRPSARLSFGKLRTLTIFYINLANTPSTIITASRNVWRISWKYLRLNFCNASIWKITIFLHCGLSHEFRPSGTIINQSYHRSIYCIDSLYSVIRDHHHLYKSLETHVKKLIKLSKINLLSPLEELYPTNFSKRLPCSYQTVLYCVQLRSNTTQTSTNWIWTLWDLWSLDIQLNLFLFNHMKYWNAVHTTYRCNHENRLRGKFDSAWILWNVKIGPRGPELIWHFSRNCNSIGPRGSELIWYLANKIRKDLCWTTQAHQANKTKLKKKTTLVLLRICHECSLLLNIFKILKFKDILSMCD